MSGIVKLHVPPFAPTSPRSLAALRRPLVQEEASHCASHCRPCAQCEAQRQAEIEAAKKLSADLGLRLSQLVEDALATHIARIESQQTELVQAVLAAVLPHLADTNLRNSLSDVLNKALDSLKDVTLTLTKHPDLDLGDLSEDSRLKIIDDPAHPRDSLSLRDGDGPTTLDAAPLIEACLSRLTGNDAPTPDGAKTP